MSTVARIVPFWNRAQKPQEGRCCCGRPSDLFVPVVHFVELPALTTEGRARGIGGGGGGGGDGKGDKSGGIWWFSVYCKPLQCRSGCADKPAEISKSGRNWQSNSKIERYSPRSCNGPNTKGLYVFEGAQKPSSHALMC